MFDEVASHYDIQHMTLFIKREKELLEGSSDIEIGEAEKDSAQTFTEEHFREQHEEIVKDKRREKAEEMLNQILERIAKLEG